MRKSEEIIDEQYKQLIAKFKPTFGNQIHIDISQLVGQVIEMEAKLKEKKRAAEEVPVLAKKIDNLKGRALYLLKTYS